ncbi:MAG: UDP-N-acetylmuramate--L-alanine ligase [Muribaculaceae bacterium]|nr:UDP-N-acetylmuramate--L-alanine ligase [Muribaculaceae bacterium]
MELNKYNNVYFVGAGGIGMAALVRYFMSLGKKVAGYDRTPTPLTEALIAEGADIVFHDDVTQIPTAMRNPEDTLVVYTPAVPAENNIMSFFTSGDFTVMKRAAVLGLITRNSKAICFAGTHGKTTTSTMCAHILQTSGIGCNAFLGGVARNYGSNLLLSATSPWSVIEADEYDRSFHHLRPYIAVITSTDPDHLDIYGTEEAYLESFAHFTELIKPGGALIIHEGLKLQPRVNSQVRTYTYSRESGDFHAENIRRSEGSIVFDIVGPGMRVSDITPCEPIDINIDNAIAAAAAAWLTGDVSPHAVRTAVDTFKGAERRFHFHLKETEGLRRAIIDDYAHHPDELRASIASVKALYPQRQLTVAFQPHLYSRTRDFAAQFAEALSLADSVILLDIYPAREKPIEGVTSKIIFDKITTPKKILITKNDLVSKIKSCNFDILLTVGAGDINMYLPQIVKNATEL